MGATPRNLAIILLACSLMAGCGRVTQLPSQSTVAPVAANRSGPAAAPLQQYTADDSVCRWSAAACPGGCGGGGGEAFIEPVETATDAVVRQLAGTRPAFSHDGELVATIDEGQVRVWRAEDGEPVYELAGDEFLFNPAGPSIAVRAAEEWSLWDTTSGEELYGLEEPGWSLYFSADGRTIVTQDGASSGTVRLFDAETGDKLQEFPDIRSATAISPDGTVLASKGLKNAGAFDIDTIVLWDTATGAEQLVLQAEIQSEIPLAAIRGHREIDSLAFSPDGQALLSAGRDAVRLWDVASGEHLRCFQTPNHLGADEAFWGADPETIIGKAAATVDNWCSCDPSREQDVYVWDTRTNHPTGMLGLGAGPVEAPIQLSPGAGDGSLLAWRVPSTTDMRDRRAYLWDLNARQLVGVLPTGGLLKEAALGPLGDRAVTVSMYSVGDNDNADVIQTAWETLLWDTNGDGVALTAEAQESYWTALKAAVEGKSTSTQLRSLRKAKALSPELFGDLEQIDEADAAAYGAYLERLRAVEALADDSGQAAEAFYAELRNTDPKWMELPAVDLREEVALYVGSTWNYWNVSEPDTAGLVAAYQAFAELDPTTAGAPEVIAALAEEIAPDAAALAREGDIGSAAALIAEAIALYPDLELDPDAAAQQIYDRGLVDQDSATASEGEPEAAPIAPGETVAGTLAAGEVDFWSFEAAAGTAVAIDLMADASALDTYLYLYGADGSVIGENDDFTGSNSHIELVLPQAGLYLIIAAGYGDSSGDYVLTLSEAGTEP
jgi:hypothetical protein